MRPLPSILSGLLHAAWALGALAAPPEDPRPLARQPFPGFSLRDTPDGPVIARVGPGPFDGREAPGPQRADLVVSVNGQAIDAAGFGSLLRTLSPGDPLELVIKRGPASQPKAAIPVGDPLGETLTFRARLDSRDDWLGTIGRGGPTSSQVREPGMGELETDLITLTRAAGVWGEPSGGGKLAGFLEYLRGVQAAALDAQPASPIVRAFRRPLSVDRIATRSMEDVTELLRHPDESGIDTFVAAWFGDDVTPPPPSELDALPETVLFTNQAVELVRHLRDSVSIGGPSVRDQLSTIRRARAGLVRFVTQAPTRYSLTAAVESLSPHAADAPLASLPPELAAGVTGGVRFFRRLDDGRFEVVGGDGPNTYHMNVVAVAYDTDGNDTYVFHNDQPSARGHVIVDLLGHDRYESDDDFAGPAVALCGNAFIDDRSGDDTYITTGQFSIATGLFGVGVLIDRDGNDRYQNTGPRSGWSQGVGFYGVGILLDLSGNDTYLSEKLSQGVGGTAGLGVIIDAAGDDTYTADGPNFKSAYGTPNVFLSMSQGFGFGVRGFASGGLGALHDLRGNDHYRAGEFSQGCGYSFAVGLLHDAGGDDLYDGNRYSQAAAAHQAIGVLIDDAGNDRYKGMTAASQAGAWDQSIALLLDRAGDDVYTADDLCQGAAAQQALAILIDLGGSDQFHAAGAGDASAQGCSGSNEYHFEADGQRSFSLLWDRGAGDDTFSSGRQGVVATGAANADRPAFSTLYGLFADDLPASLELPMPAEPATAPSPREP